MPRRPGDEGVSEGRAWRERLAVFLPGFLAEHPVLRGLADQASLLLHGSTTRGVADEWSDLDVWLLLPDSGLREFDGRSPTRFFEFALDGKPGHANAISLPELARRLQGCDLALIAELRRAQVLADPKGAARALVERARLPMRPDVRTAFFRYHYVEMRGDHKACQSPTNRGDPLALLQLASKTLGHALRAALVLDREPYPYDKWLAHDARETPTGTVVERGARRVLDLLARDVLRQPGPERDHPLGLALREIRVELIDAARAGGIDGPWLDEWWLYIDEARRGAEEVSWTPRASESPFP